MSAFCIVHYRCLKTTTPILCFLMRSSLSWIQLSSRIAVSIRLPSQSELAQTTSDINKSKPSRDKLALLESRLILKFLIRWLLKILVLFHKDRKNDKKAKVIILWLPLAWLGLPVTWFFLGRCTEIVVRHFAKTAFDVQLQGYYGLFKFMAYRFQFCWWNSHILNEMKLAKRPNCSLFLFRKKSARSV